MADQSGKGRKKESRRDRLKLALRENLRRRKAQQRERGKLADTPSSSRDAPTHGQVGKVGD